MTKEERRQKAIEKTNKLKELLADPPDTEEEWIEAVLDYAIDPVVMSGPALGPNRGRPHLVICDLADNWGVLYACPMGNLLTFSDSLTKRIRGLIKERKERFEQE